MGALEVARFGRAGEHARAGKVFDAVVLDVDVVDAAGVAHVRRVEIAGRTLPLGVGAGASITLIKRPKQKWDDVWVEAERDRAVLRSFLDHALLSASGVAADVPHSSLIVRPRRRAARASASRSSPCRATKRRCGYGESFASSFRDRTRTSCLARRSSCTRGRTPPARWDRGSSRRARSSATRRAPSRCAPRTVRCLAPRTTPRPTRTVCGP